MSESMQQTLLDMVLKPHLAHQVGQVEATVALVSASGPWIPEDLDPEQLATLVAGRAAKHLALDLEDLAQAGVALDLTEEQQETYLAAFTQGFTSTYYRLLPVASDLRARHQQMVKVGYGLGRIIPEQHH